MEKTPKEMLKSYVDSQKFNSTTEIMDAMKEMFRDVLQQVMESELDTELGYEKSQRMSDSGVENKPRNYRNGYSKKTVKTQLGAVDVKVPRDRNGEYEPQIIGKYSRNADGMEEKILGLFCSPLFYGRTTFTMFFGFYETGVKIWAKGVDNLGKLWYSNLCRCSPVWWNW